MKELEPTLVCPYVADSEVNSVLIVKRTLLDLWQALILYLDKAVLIELAPPFFSLIMTIIKRPEFNVDRLLTTLNTEKILGGNGAPSRSVSMPALASILADSGNASPGQSAASPSQTRRAEEQIHEITAAELATLEPEVALCERYRILLFNTLRVITRRLGAATAQSDLALIPQNQVRIGKNRPTIGSGRPAQDSKGGQSPPASPSRTKEDEAHPIVAATATPTTAAVAAPTTITTTTTTTTTPTSITGKDDSTRISAGLETSKSVAEMLGASLPSNTDVLDVGAPSSGAAKPVSPTKAAEPGEEPAKVTFLAKSPSRLPLVEKQVTQMAPLFDLFAVQFLAVAFWRLPQIQEHILDSIKKRITLPSSLQPFRENEPWYDSTTDEFSQLFRWAEFHQVLKCITCDTEEERFAMLSKPWLAQFAKMGSFFMRFFVEWTGHLRIVRPSLVILGIY